MTYSDKLKSPKWQKKRLEIMQRDGFKCKICDCESETLHVHHIDYSDNLAPWEYSNNRLITLCKGHHAMIHGRDQIIIINQGILSVYDFIQKYPGALNKFSLIENHEGIWNVEFTPQDCHIGLIGKAYIFETIFILSQLILFMGELDNSLCTD